MYHYKTFTERFTSPLVTHFDLLAFQNMCEEANSYFKYNYKLRFYPTENSGFFGGTCVYSDTKALMSFALLVRCSLANQ